MRRTAPWAFALCGWRQHAYFMELSSFYRYPFTFPFESVAHLLYLLATTSLPALWALSDQMRRFNARLRADEVKFWGNLLLASACAGEKLCEKTKKMPRAAVWRQGIARNTKTVTDSSLYVAPSFGTISRDPRCLFGLPACKRTGGLDALACCPAACGSCKADGCMERGALSGLGTEACCPSSIATRALPCTNAPPPCRLMRESLQRRRFNNGRHRIAGRSSSEHVDVCAARISRQDMR